MIIFTDDIKLLNSEMLQGFFQEWKKPKSSSEHLLILKNSTYFIVAIDSDTNKVVGFITVLSDGIQSAFIPLLEVISTYKKNGIGKKLVEKVLKKFAAIPAIDLTCDPDVQTFYEKCGMIKSVGMIIRNY